MADSPGTELRECVTTLEDAMLDALRGLPMDSQRRLVSMCLGANGKPMFKLVDGVVEYA